MVQELMLCFLDTLFQFNSIKCYPVICTLEAVGVGVGGGGYNYILFLNLELSYVTLHHVEIW